MSPDDVLRAATPSPARLEALYDLINQALVRGVACGRTRAMIETNKFQGLELATIRREYENVGWLTKIVSDQREVDYVEIFSKRNA